MPYYFLTCETHFGECVSIIEMNQDEHGGRMGGYFWFNKEFLGTINSITMEPTQ
jgi:hypothetical protein